VPHDLINHQYPKTLNYGDWIGHECQQGFYTFYYIGESAINKTLVGSGAEKIISFNIPHDHKLNIIGIAKEGVDSDIIEVRYLPVHLPDNYYDILYSATTTAKSILIELGSAYENLGGARIDFVITGTNGKFLVPRVNIKFLEVPNG